MSHGNSRLKDLAAVDCAFVAATWTDKGTERDHNEDASGVLVESDTCGVVVVADGVSSGEGGEVASQMAVEVTLRAFQEEPRTRPAGLRLYRAVQQANIEVYDRSVVVTPLRGMSTTLTAVAVDRGELTAVHVGDSRLYLIRNGEIEQLTRDHTVAADKARFGLISEERARNHPDKSTLTRCLGRDLIVNRDRLAHPLRQNDVLMMCSDGLYNILPEKEIVALASKPDVDEASRALVEATNQLGSYDNVTAAVIRMVGPIAAPTKKGGLTGMASRLIGRFAAKTG
jgi:serine/threonine protein phosphatase PrpC